MILFALESPGFESNTDILSLSLFCHFYVVSIITAKQRTLLMKIFIYDYTICDRPFSHMGQKYPFLWLSEIFLSRLLVSSLDTIAVSNCPSLPYIDAQELLLQHMFLGCNCIYKHFVERKKQCIEILEHFLYSVFCHKNYSTRIWTESVSWHHQD